MRRIIAIAALALASVGVASAVATVAPQATGSHVATAAASVSGNGCTITWYYDAQGRPNKVFRTCYAGTTYWGFQAGIYCSDGGIYYGNVQTQPGPWLGSTRACPAGKYATSTFINFIH